MGLISFVERTRYSLKIANSANYREFYVLFGVIYFDYSTIGVTSTKYIKFVLIYRNE